MHRDKQETDRAEENQAAYKTIGQIPRRIAATGRGRQRANLGHAADAAEQTAKAVEAGHKLLPSGSPRLSPVYADYAYVLNMLNRSKEAEAHARQSLAWLPGDVPAIDLRRAAPQLAAGGRKPAIPCGRRSTWHEPAQACRPWQGIEGSLRPACSG